MQSSYKYCNDCNLKKRNAWHTDMLLFGWIKKRGWGSITQTKHKVRDYIHRLAPFYPHEKLIDIAINWRHQFEVFTLPASLFLQHGSTEKKGANKIPCWLNEADDDINKSVITSRFMRTCFRLFNMLLKRFLFDDVCQWKLFTFCFQFRKKRNRQTSRQIPENAFPGAWVGFVVKSHIRQEGRVKRGEKRRGRMVKQKKEASQMWSMR